MPPLQVISSRGLIFDSLSMPLTIGDTLREIPAALWNSKIAWGACCNGGRFTLVVSGRPFLATSSIAWSAFPLPPSLAQIGARQCSLPIKSTHFAGGAKRFLFQPAHNNAPAKARLLDRRTARSIDSKPPLGQISSRLIRPAGCIPRGNGERIEALSASPLPERPGQQRNHLTRLVRSCRG